MIIRNRKNDLTEKNKRQAMLSLYMKMIADDYGTGLLDPGALFANYRITKALTSWITGITYEEADQIIDECFDTAEVPDYIWTALLCTCPNFDILASRKDELCDMIEEYGWEMEEVARDIKILGFPKFPADWDRYNYVCKNGTFVSRNNRK